MAVQPEENEFPVGIYQFETTDLVEGGLGGIDNLPLLQLASRTLWLYNRANDLETMIDAVDDALQEEIQDRIDADAAILAYIPKRRGYFFGLDIAGDAVGTSYTCNGFTSAIVTQDGSFTTTVRVTMPPGIMTNTNYRVDIGLQSLASGALDQVASDIYKPVYKIISTTQFDIVFRESDTGITQNLKVHLDIVSLNI
jgi:hypothetical protein